MTSRRSPTSSASHTRLSTCWLFKHAAQNQNGNLNFSFIAPILPQDHCEATKLKKYPDPEINDANVDEVIKLVSEDSPACKEINFNNIQV